MIIGITGDTHNNLKNIDKICTIFKKNGAEVVFHTGDISLPKSLLAFNQLDCPLIAVLGNNDIPEKKGLDDASKEFDCKIFKEPHFIEINEKKFSILHHPELINREMVYKSDYIIHGHTHRFRLEKVENCIIFNPGECAGFLKGKNQVGLIDTSVKEPKVINF